MKGADGKIVSRYHFVTEEEYQEMKKDDKLAKKILGLAEDEELDDWVSSKQKYIVDEKGELVKGMDSILLKYINIYCFNLISTQDNKQL